MLNPSKKMSDRPQPASAEFAINHRELDERTSVISVEGELDLASAPSLKWTLVDLLRAGRIQLVIDLSQVTFMDSTALGVLIGFDRSLTAGQRLAIASPQPNVVRIFEVTGLDGKFFLFPTVEEALDHAQGSVARSR
jgi:anti-sigma B factor antagonist